MGELFEQVPPHKFFMLKSANEWMTQAKELPPQRMLVGTLFFENEVSILFGETNCGKSIAAVQIADAISRGTGIGPLQNTAGPVKVISILRLKKIAELNIVGIIATIENGFMNIVSYGFFT